MGVSRAPPVPGTSTLYVFIARASVVRAGLPSVVAPRHRESARSTDGCRYARAGHAARVRFTLIDLKFTKYVENDTRFIVHLCIGFALPTGIGSRDETALTEKHTARTARPSSRPAPASPSFADAR